MADGPVGQSFILGPVGPRRMFSQYELNQPVGTHEMVSNCKRMDRIADSPVGSTEIPDPAEETESPIQTDFTSLGDTPPSSDSGVHSLGEQWENMSTNTIDMESEQNERSTNGSPMGRRGSDTRVPPNTEEDEDINDPWTDCMLNEEFDESSSINIPNYRKDIQYNYVTICEKEDSSVNSGTDGGNSDIGVLADFSDDEEESEVEQFSGCRIPCCQCEGRIEYMEWGSDDMTETDDSEYEDPDERANRLYVESDNYDFSKGMTVEIYTPPLRKNRRICSTDRSRSRRQAWAGRDSHGPSDEYCKDSGHPVTEAMTEMAGNDANISRDDYSDLVDQLVRETMRAWASGQVVSHW